MHRRIGDCRGIALNAAQSTLERLCRKDLLAREKVGHVYVYARLVRREQSTERLIEDVVDRT